MTLHTPSVIYKTATKITLIHQVTYLSYANYPHVDARGSCAIARAHKAIEKRADTFDEYTCK